MPPDRRQKQAHSLAQDPIIDKNKARRSIKFHGTPRSTATSSLTQSEDNNGHLARLNSPAASVHDSDEPTLTQGAGEDEQVSHPSPPLLVDPSTSQCHDPETYTHTLPRTPGSSPLTQLEDELEYLDEAPHPVPPSSIDPSTFPHSSYPLVTPFPSADGMEIGDDRGEQFEADADSHSSALPFQAPDENHPIISSSEAIATEDPAEAQSPPCDEDHRTAAADHTAADQAHACQDTGGSGGSQEEGAPQDGNEIELNEATGHETEAEWTYCIVKLEGRPVTGGRGTFQATSFVLGPEQSKHFRVVYRHPGRLELRNSPLLGGYESEDGSDTVDSAPSGTGQDVSGRWGGLGDQVSIRFTLHAHPAYLPQATVCALARGAAITFVVRNRNNHHIGFNVTHHPDFSGRHHDPSTPLPRHSAVDSPVHAANAGSSGQVLQSDELGVSNATAMNSDVEDRSTPCGIQDARDADGDSQEPPYPSPDCDPARAAPVSVFALLAQTQVREETMDGKLVDDYNPDAMDFSVGDLSDLGSMCLDTPMGEHPSPHDEDLYYIDASSALDGEDHLFMTYGDSEDIGQNQYSGPYDEQDDLIDYQSPEEHGPDELSNSPLHLNVRNEAIGTEPALRGSNTGEHSIMHSPDTAITAEFHTNRSAIPMSRQSMVEGTILPPPEEHLPVENFVERLDGARRSMIDITDIPSMSQAEQLKKIEDIITMLAAIATDIPRLAASIGRD